MSKLKCAVDAPETATNRPAHKPAARARRSAVASASQPNRPASPAPADTRERHRVVRYTTARNGRSTSTSTTPRSRWRGKATALRIQSSAGSPTRWLSPSTPSPRRWSWTTAMSFSMLRRRSSRSGRRFTASPARPPHCTASGHSSQPCENLPCAGGGGAHGRDSLPRLVRPPRGSRDARLTGGGRCAGTRRPR